MRISDWSSDVCSSDLWGCRCSKRLHCWRGSESRLGSRDLTLPHPNPLQQAGEGELVPCGKSGRGRRGDRREELFRMTEEIMVHVNPREPRVAGGENGVLHALPMQRGRWGGVEGKINTR